MTLRDLRKKATEGPRAQCPACGKNIPVLELTNGRHVASGQCEPFKQAAREATIPKYQKQLQQQHSQAKLVTRHMTWSERHFDLLGESNFIRQYWAPSILALSLLSWLVGWVTPQGSGTTYFWTFIAGPIGTVILIVLAFKGKAAWVHNPFKRQPTKTE